MIFSPLILQWRDHTLFGKPYHHRANALFWLPTGSYSSQRQLNIGANTWRFNPYYAGTLILSPEWEVSFRLMYLWSTKNTSPNPFIASSSIQPGTAFHMNYSVSYEIKHGLRAGLAGYYLNQTRRDRVDNMSVVDSGEKIYALGPGFIWKNKAGITTFNAYGEFGAENRPEGFSVVARHAWVW